MRSFLFCMFTFLLCGSAYSLEVRLEPARAVASLGEVFYMQVHINDAGGADCRVDFPPHGAFEIHEAGVSQTQSVRIIGAQVEREHTWIRNYAVRAKELGEFTLGPVSVTLGGQRYTTAAAAIHVQAARPQQPQQGRRGLMDFFSRDPLSREDESMEVYVETLFDKKTAWVGEGVVQYVDIHASRPRVVGVQFAQAARDGFWEILPEKYDHVRPLRYTRDGKDWYRYRYTIAYLFPLTSGARVIPPFAVRVDYNQFWTRSQIFQTEPLRLDTRPLPPGEGANFSGAVGRFTITGEFVAGHGENRERFIKDKPFTLALTINGFGNIRSLSAPIFSDTPHFRIMPPQQQTRVDMREGRVYGSTSFRYLIYPLSTGSFSLPEAGLRAFDPAVPAYYDLVYAAPALLIEQAAEGEGEQETHKEQGAAVYDFSPPESDLPPGALPFSLGFSFSLLFLVLLFFFAGVARERRRRFDEQHPALALRKYAALRARSALRGLSAEDPKEAAPQIMQALRLYAAERTGAGRGATLEALAGALACDQVPDAFIKAWRSLEEDCTALSYGGGQGDTASLLATARTLLNNFEESRA